MTRDVALAREALDQFADRVDVAALAGAAERVVALPEFAVMAAAASSYRPQWAGVLDSLYQRPLLVTARGSLHNALGATFRGETLYYHAFSAFVDAVIIWHYAYTQERVGEARLNAIHDTVARLLTHRERFLVAADFPVPDAAFFGNLKRVSLSRGRGYALIRSAGRYLAALEGRTLERKVSTLRGTVTMSLSIFSAQVIAMSAAVHAGQSAIDMAHAGCGLEAYLLLLQTHPSAATASAAG